MKASRYISMMALCGSCVFGFSQDVSITLGDASTMLNYAGVPIFPWFPDGHISILKEADSDKYTMYWAGSSSYRTLGDYPFPEYQLTRSPTQSILGAKTDVDAWDNGGSWLMSVFRINGDTLVGFYHAEDHYYGTDNPGNIAWKSLARVVSFNNGTTWEQSERIMTSNTPKPESPTWGGAGDNAVIWDEVNNRWLCYYQEHNIMMAMSEDPLGRPGTWYKYYAGAFSEPGLEGVSTPVNGLTIAGGNPSLHFNHHLNKYVIVYHGWNRSIYLSTSADGINWQVPTRIIAPTGQRRVWYPTIIGDADVSAGKVARIYYADMAPDLSSRSFVSKAIIFDDAKTFKTPNWAYEKVGSFPMKGSFDSLSSGTYRILSFDGSLEETATYGYHYQPTDASFASIFRLSIDSDLPGPVGFAVRAGLSDSDKEIVIAYDGNQILLKDGTQLVGGVSGDTVALYLEKRDQELTIAYQDETGNSVVIYNATWPGSSTLLGFFSMGSPDQPAMGYVSDLSIDPFVPLGVDRAQPEVIYPNPTIDTIHIRGGETIERVILMHLDGRIALETTDGHKVSVGHLPNGIYVLKIIRSNGQVAYEKVVIGR